MRAFPQFTDFLGYEVLVKTKKEGSYKGVLLREDPYFLILKDVLIVDSKTTAPRLAISKRAVIELRVLGGAEND